MRKVFLAAFVFIVALLLFCTAGNAQLNPQQGHGAPSGPCLSPYIDIDAGNLYVCKTGQYALSGGGSGGACLGPLCFNPTSSGVVANGVTRNDATWASSGTQVTITASDAPFTAGEGPACWGMPGLQQGPSQAGVYAFVDATHANCTISGGSGALIGSASSNGLFTTCKDDTNAWQSVAAALYKSQGGGMVQLPQGKSCVSRGIGGLAATGCNLTYPTGFALNYCYIIGSSSSWFLPMPGYSFTLASGNTDGCSTNGCFFNPPNEANMIYQYFSIDGTDQSLQGVTPTGVNNLFTVGANGWAVNLNFFNWATNTGSSPCGFAISGGGAYGIGVAVSGWGESPFGMCGQSNNASCYQCFSSATVQVGSGSTWTDYNGIYNTLTNQPAIFLNGGTFIGHGTVTTCPSSGTQPGVAMNDGSVLKLFDNSQINSGSCPTGAFGIQYFQTNNSTTYLEHSTIGGGATANSLKSTSGKWTFGYGVSLLQAVSLAGAAVSGITNPGITALCATGNFALTSGWGTSSVTSVAANGNIQGCHVTITGAAGSASPVLTWTYPVATAIAPGSCHLSGASGTLTGVSTGTPGTTSVAYTFTGTPSAQTYIFDVGCP